MNASNFNSYYVEYCENVGQESSEEDYSVWMDTHCQFCGNEYFEGVCGCDAYIRY